jgi:hypothetical protein
MVDIGNFAAAAKPEEWRAFQPIPVRGFRNRFSVGGVLVEITSDAGEDASLGLSLEAFGGAGGLPDVCIRAERVANLKSAGTLTLFDSGSTWRLYGSEDTLQFDFTVPAAGQMPYRRLFVDRHFRRAIVQTNASCFEAFPQAKDPLNYPLVELLIMHRLTQERAIELHGSGIVRANGVANLFVGHSGAGKSTTTRLWTSREEVEVLCDDRIIVRLDDGRDGPDGPTGMRMYGTPWHGEAMFASPNSAPLTRIFILEHGHGNVITSLTRSHAVGELFARAFVPFHRHEYIENALSFLDQLVSSVPCYRYSFEPDERAVEKVIHFQD